MGMIIWHYSTDSSRQTNPATTRLKRSQFFSTENKSVQIGHVTLLQISSVTSLICAFNRHRDLCTWRPLKESLSALWIRESFFSLPRNTGLFEMIVEVLTKCLTQCTWDSSICNFLFLSMGLRQGSGLCSSFSRQVSRNWRYESEPPLKPSPLTCYRQLRTNSIIVLMSVESQRVHI